MNFINNINKLIIDNINNMNLANISGCPHTMYTRHYAIRFTHLNLIKTVRAEYNNY